MLPVCVAMLWTLQPSTYHAASAPEPNGWPPVRPRECSAMDG